MLGDLRAVAGVPAADAPSLIPLLASAPYLWQNGPMQQRATLTPRERQEEADRFTASLAGLAVALVLGVAGLWVADGLAHVSKLEDCLLQGRMNCERIELSPVP